MSHRQRGLATMSDWQENLFSLASRKADKMWKKIGRFLAAILQMQSASVSHSWCNSVLNQNFWSSLEFVNAIPQQLRHLSFHIYYSADWSELEPTIMTSLTKVIFQCFSITGNYAAACYDDAVMLLHHSCVKLSVKISLQYICIVHNAQRHSSLQAATKFAKLDPGGARSLDKNWITSLDPPKYKIVHTFTFSRRTSSISNIASMRDYILE